MVFQTKEELKKFLNDESYYANNESYCLGSTLEEAGKILKIIVDNGEKEDGENERGE